MHRHLWKCALPLHVVTLLRLNPSVHVACLQRTCRFARLASKTCLIAAPIFVASAKTDTPKIYLLSSK
jgi:hypothetical protein